MTEAMHHKPDRGLRTVAVFESIKGAVVLFAGLAMLLPAGLMVGIWSLVFFVW